MGCGAGAESRYAAEPPRVVVVGCTHDSKATRLISDPKAVTQAAAAELSPRRSAHETSSCSPRGQVPASPKGLPPLPSFGVGQSPRRDQERSMPGHTTPAAVPAGLPALPQKPRPPSLLQQQPNGCGAAAVPAFDQQNRPPELERRSPSLALPDSRSSSPPSVPGELAVPVLGSALPSEQAPPPQPRTVSSVKIGEFIGSGVAGRVLLGLSEESGELVAVKEFDVQGDEELEGLLRQEVSVLQAVAHPNIVQYLGHVVDSEDCRHRLRVFIEYMPAGSLSQVLSTFGALDDPTARRYSQQLVSGLSYLHSRKIVHRDLKAANILIGVDGTLKLSDFGSCKVLLGRRGGALGGVDDNTVTHCQTMLAHTMVGSVLWMAPEVVQAGCGAGYGPSSDIWSLGCVVIEMATAGQPWGDGFDNPIAALYLISKSDSGPPVPDDLSPAAQDFVRECFHRKPCERPSAARLQGHAWLASDSVEPWRVLREVAAER